MKFSKYFNKFNLILFLGVLTLGALLFIAVKSNHELQRQISTKNIELTKIHDTCDSNLHEASLVFPNPKCGRLARSPDEMLLSDLNWQDFDFHGEKETAIVSGNNDKGELADVIEPDVQFPIDFPKAAVEAIFFKGSENYEKRGCYASFDLNGDGVKEIFVTRGIGMNGLGAVAILGKKKNQWREIFQGAATLILHRKNWFEKHPEDSKLDHSYFYITEWRYDAHQYWQVLNAYNGQKYQLINGQDLPWAIAGSDSFRSMFWETSYFCPTH